MKKSTLLSALLLGACMLLASCSADRPENTAAETSHAETVSEDSEENLYYFISPNYTVENGVLTAKKTTYDTEEQLMSAAMRDDVLLEGDFAAEVTLTRDNIYSSAGILFRGAISTEYDNIEGYAFMIRDNRVYLYEISGSKYSGMMITELSSDVVEKAKYSDSIRLRIERDGNTFRMYYLDDMDGVEPWPEIEFICNMHHGIGIGVIDNGHGASFSDLTVTEYTAPESGTNEYSNPVFSALQAADPYVLYHDGKYYCYSTSAPVGYYVYVSDDMVNWSNAGLCIEEAWGIDKNYWAPEVIESGGKFYMIMTVNEHLGFAVADSPLGPFVPEETWLLEQSIDGHIFIDDDGQAYLYYVSWKDGTHSIYGCELEDDIVTIRPGTEKHLLKPELSWETHEGRITEGPFILKHNGTYYLTYSGSDYKSHDYAVGYATSDSPLGDYVRYYASPILSKTSKMFGPGHHSFTYSESGELFIVYHVHASKNEVHPRVTCIDRARFAPTESGVDRIEIFGPTHTKQQYP